MFFQRLFAATIVSALLTGCGGGGGSSYTPPSSRATANPGGSSTADTGFTCPTSETAFGTSGTSAGVQAKRRATSGAAFASPSLVTVTYRTAAISSPAAMLDDTVARAGARFVSQQNFAALGRSTRVLAVSPSDVTSAVATLRAQAGVIAVQQVQRLRSMTTNAYLTNDPYFKGEVGASAPLYEAADQPGQWDMHVMGLQNAFAYSQPGNGSGITNAGALGSTNVKLAIIDTGMDVTQPDLKSDTIVRTRCFITSDSGIQSTGTFVADPEGHGTDVTGLAADGTNNDFGFAGAAGNVSLMLYRVFPTPDDNCTSDNSTDSRCGAADVDVATALDDAVANGANVVNLSLGGGTCTAGQDPDPVEGTAIENAIAHKVIVVAAAGNSGSPAVDAPACDSGVIAVGASAYNDGVANGSGYAGSNKEYVATSYSHYGSVNVAKSTSSWGLVAPGGDPASDTDTDDLHWIENIWTSTPYDSNFAGTCGTDVFGEANNCRTLIAGTSMSSAHVAGAAALVLSVSGTSGSYASPAAMYRLLCTTADDIGDPHQGCGRVNVYRAIATALDDPHLP